MMFLLNIAHSFLAVSAGRSITIATAAPTSESLPQPCYSIVEDLASTTISEIGNENYIFNAIHSSMRQWGSSWHHNGMSFFLATVPEATQFYHGTDTPKPINGTQWLAFEPEHALVFATRGPPPRGGGPEGPGGRPPPPPSSLLSSHHGQDDRLSTKDKKSEGDHHRSPQSRKQEPLGFMNKPKKGRKRPPPNSPHQSAHLDEQPASGWLHTYVTKHALSLLYIDGMSGAKTSKGTLDSQDYLLLNWTSDSRRENPMFGEHDRAEGLCSMAQDQWKGKIDGFLRMEAGFEIILCNFEKHLDLVRATHVKRQEKQGNSGNRDKPGGPPRGGPPGGNVWSWFPAIAARYHGIGGERVTLNYNHFVTAFNYGFDLFSPPLISDKSTITIFPRLQNISVQSLDMVRRDVDDLILSHAPTESNIGVIDWQSRADMIVTRYSNKLRYWHTLNNESQIKVEATNLMKPFIDSVDRDSDAEIERCTYQFLPYPSETSAQPLAYHALSAVSRRVCTTLSDISYPMEPARLTKSGYTFTDTYTLISDLMTYLSWSSFAECPDPCALNEICFIPIWPLGSKLEHAQGYGRCVNETSLDGEIRGGPGVDIMGIGTMGERG